MCISPLSELFYLGSLIGDGATALKARLAALRCRRISLTDKATILLHRPVLSEY